ncbi:hypothetical protein, partial [Buttiauxella agrestis]|uniref:hypothetical protein n=1 Tax=Buttiauxella agrestis TaxID=82977 RepID=UPI0039757096
MIKLPLRGKPQLTPNVQGRSRMLGEKRCLPLAAIDLPGVRVLRGATVVLNPKTWTRSLLLYFHLSPVLYRTHSTRFQTNTLI